MTQLLDLQKFLFENKPSRMDLISCDYTGSKKKKVFVYRNHSFELIQTVAKPYLAYADLDVDFKYSDYDDSLSFMELDTNCDAVMVWIDAKRYSDSNVNDFVMERLKKLKELYRGPVLLCVTGANLDIKMPDVLNVSLDYIEKEMGDDLYDEKLEPLTGTRLSSVAIIKLAADFGLRYLPAILLPGMKAIFVDLDNTLYSGVLGENGAENLILSEGHIRLQKLLKDLVAQNFMLCIVSKNNPDDVKMLFEKRKDFPLQYSDFTHVSASWNPKSEMIKETLGFLNIGADSCLFIDDNIGEISNVIGAFPSIKYILADCDGYKTADVLSVYPGFLPFRVSNEDNLRKGDLQANEERRKMQESMSADDFLKNLNMQINIIANDIDGQERIAQLAGKTNQFIFNYKRYSLSDIQNLMSLKNSVVVSMHLKDNLSDSGMIGAMVLTAKDNIATMEECFISCRALGRGIDNVIIFKAIEYGLKTLKCTKLCVLFQKGERNEPAQRFFDKYLSKYSSVNDFEPLPDNDLVKFNYVTKGN